jgi:hypothetical protein
MNHSHLAVWRCYLRQHAHDRPNQVEEPHGACTNCKVVQELPLATAARLLLPATPFFITRGTGSTKSGQRLWEFSVSARPEPPQTKVGLLY